MIEQALHRAGCTSTARRAAAPAFIRCMGRSFEPCDRCKGTSPYVFVTEAGTPVTTAWLIEPVDSSRR
jgi:hypothetical protein